MTTELKQSVAVRPEHTALALVMSGMAVPQVVPTLMALHGVSHEEAAEAAADAAAFAQMRYGVFPAGNT